MAQRHGSEVHICAIAVKPVRRRCSVRIKNQYQLTCSEGQRHFDNVGHFPGAVPAATSILVTALRGPPRPRNRLNRWWVIAGASMSRRPGPTSATIALIAITRAPTVRRAVITSRPRTAVIARRRRAPNPICPPALSTIPRGPGALLTIPLRAGIPRPASPRIPNLQQRLDCVVVTG